MSTELIKQAVEINPAFANAIQLGEQAANVGNFNPAKKLKLAEQAVDEMKVVLAQLIVTVEGITNGKNEQ